MKRFEYYVLTHNVRGKGIFNQGGIVDPEDLNKELNSLGRQGWELVSGTTTNMVHGNSRDIVLILKRELPPAS